MAGSPRSSSLGFQSRAQLRAPELVVSLDKIWSELNALPETKIGFREIFISYSQRLGEKKLRPWRDGFQNLMFLFRKRLGI